MNTALQNWETSFEEQISDEAYNTAPVEAVIRTVSYHLREARKATPPAARLHFLEMGCGAGPNLAWLAGRGIDVSGVDISPTALRLAFGTLESRGLAHRLRGLHQAPVSGVPLADDSCDGVIEACVFQHLNRPDRRRAFDEVYRVLKPGGVFVGYMLDDQHTIYRTRHAETLKDDPGSLVLEENGPRYHLANLGLSHFFSEAEIRSLMKAFSLVDPTRCSYFLPTGEARRRGYDRYLQSMWTVYAVK